MKTIVCLVLLICSLSLQVVAEDSLASRSVVCTSQAVASESITVTTDSDGEFDKLDYLVDGKPFGDFGYWELFDIFISGKDGDEVVYVVIVDDDLESAVSIKLNQTQEVILEQKDFICK